MSKAQQATADELEDFEQFLFEMDDVLEALLKEAAQMGVPLDYSLDSLGRLEALIDMYLNRPAAEPDLIKNRAGRYLGEVFRRHIGGKWELCLKDPKYMYFKLPVVSGYANVPIEFSPISVVGNYMARRKAGLLHTAVTSNEEWKRPAT